MENIDPDETRELEPIDDDDSNDGSNEIVVEDPQTGKKTKLKRRELIRDDDGNTFLVVNVRKRYKQRIWKRSVKRIETFYSLLYDHPLVDKKLVKKTEFTPITGEDSIRVWTRLHWLQHGPKQIGIVLVAAICMIMQMWFGFYGAIEPVLSLLIFLVIAVGLVIAYACVWIPWAYHYLIVTNLRVILIYKPPFGLPGSMASLKISDILTVETIDQSRVKFLPSLGNLLPKFGLTGYKILHGDTAAQGDEWFNDGIKFVRFADEVEHIIASTQAEAHAIAGKRHDEDMDFQRRQAVASERSAELLEVLVAKDAHNDS